jgi:hypothetical protein
MSLLGKNILGVQRYLVRCVLITESLLFVSWDGKLGHSIGYSYLKLTNQLRLKYIIILYANYE